MTFVSHQKSLALRNFPNLRAVRFVGYDSVAQVCFDEYPIHETDPPLSLVETLQLVQQYSPPPCQCVPASPCSCPRSITFEVEVGNRPGRAPLSWCLHAEALLKVIGVGNSRAQMQESVGYPVFYSIRDSCACAHNPFSRTACASCLSSNIRESSEPESSQVCWPVQSHG